MHKNLLLYLSVPFALLLATDLMAADPRNTKDYRVLFDIAAVGELDLVKGYGAYVQIYSTPDTHLFRFCDNFEGKGLSGRPNLSKERMRLVPIGTTDPRGYKCKEFLPTEVAEGQVLIKFGNRTFFAMKAAEWTQEDGGAIRFQFARRVPLLGTPTYRILPIRATRASGSLYYIVEALLPRAGIHPTHFLEFAVSGSGLGLPNGISGLTLNPKGPLELEVDPDTLDDST